jgi:hypothetical protein
MLFHCLKLTSLRCQHPTQTSKLTHDNGYQHSIDRGTVAAHSNGTSYQSSRPEFSQRRMDTFNSSHSSKSNQALEGGYLAPARLSALIRKDSNISEAGSAQDSLLDLYGSNSPNRSGMNSMDLGDRKDTDGEQYINDEDSESSRWIHRDKLARIESEELQAAGILLPQPRAQSKSNRRERSRDQQSNGLGRSEQSGQHQKRQRIGSLPTEEAEAEDQQDMSWDLRLPEEAAQDTNGGYREHGSGQKGISRIPVFKTSPLPIPLDYLERDTPIQRTRSNGWAGDDDAIQYPKSRTRSDSNKQAEDLSATPTPIKRIQSDTSPSKKAATASARKGSMPSTRAPSAQARPKTRSGPKDTPISRPPTRSGEPAQSNSIKRPEGDPPWLASMYKPDPRLPPDQQLLPTVAKRLQQEQWEKEGKFGNAYDKEFRPLNDEELQPPEIVSQTVEVPEQKPEEHSEWPLRTSKSPTLSTGRPGTAGGYSTVPKIQDIPPSPMSPRATMTPQPIPLRVEEPREEKKQKEGCGCCIVM